MELRQYISLSVVFLQNAALKDSTRVIQTNIHREVDVSQQNIKFIRFY